MYGNKQEAKTKYLMLKCVTMNSYIRTGILIDLFLKVDSRWTILFKSIVVCEIK